MSRFRTLLGGTIFGLVATAGLGAGQSLELAPGSCAIYALDSDSTDAACRLGATGEPGDAVHFLLGGTGIVESDALRGERGIVPPLTLSEADVGFVWRAVGQETRRTRVMPPERYHGWKLDDPRRILYLTADHLTPAPVEQMPHAASVDTIGAGWQLLRIDPADSTRELRVRSLGGPATAFLLTETQSGGYRISDRDRIPEGYLSPIDLLVPGGPDHALLLRWDGRITPLETSLLASTAPLSTWRRITDDDGEFDSHWGQLSGPGVALLKLLVIDRDPATIRAARLEYHMAREPYAASRKKTVGRGATLADLNTQLIATVNGVETMRVPVAQAGTFGWHEWPIDVAALRRGTNEIRLSIEGGDYIYVSLDLDTDHGRSGAVLGDVVDMNTLRPGGQVGPGEYMIRMRIR